MRKSTKQLDELLKDIIADYIFNNGTAVTPMHYDLDPIDRDRISVLMLDDGDAVNFEIDFTDRLTWMTLIEVMRTEDSDEKMSFSDLIVAQIKKNLLPKIDILLDEYFSSALPLCGDLKEEYDFMQI